MIQVAIFVILLVILAALVVAFVRPRGPSKAQREEAQLTQELREMRKALMDLDKAPLTPPETSLWFNKLLVTMWTSYVHPLMLENLAPSIQEHLDRRLPPGTVLRIENMHLGLCPPQFSNFKVLSSKGGKGGIPCFEVDLKFLSDQACIELSGSKTEGGLVPRRRPVRIRVDLLRISGTLRFTPVQRERLVLWSFKEPPKVTVGARALMMTGAAGSQRLDATSSLDLQGTLERVLESDFTLPRRHCSAIDHVRSAAIARARTLSLTVHGCRGLPEVEGGAGPRRTFVRVRCGPQAGHTDVAEGCEPSFQEAFSFSLDEGTEGKVILELCEGGPGEGSQGIAQAAVLGQAMVDFKDLEDGTVAVWATGDGLLPVAKRLDGPGGASWPVKVPLLGLAPASLVLEASLTDWEDTSAGAGVNGGSASEAAQAGANATAEGSVLYGGARSAQPRVITLHITGLDWTRSATAEASSKDQYYIRVVYGDEELSTRCHALSADDAEWDEAFVIEESFLAAARRIRFQLMHRKPERGDQGVDEEAEGKSAPILRAHGDLCVASASLSLDSLRRGREARRLVMLGEVLGESGRLFVEVEAVNPTEARSAVIARSLWDVTHNANSAAGIRPSLTVHVKQARNLIATRTLDEKPSSGTTPRASATGTQTPRGPLPPPSAGPSPGKPAAPIPSADPFCVVTYGGQLHRSKVVRNSLHPKLDLRSQFEFVAGRLLEIEVWDLSSDGDTSECLGSVVVNPGELPLDREYEQWVRLEGVASGEVQLYLCRKAGSEALGPSHRSRSVDLMGLGEREDEGQKSDLIPASALQANGGPAAGHRRAESALPAIASLFIAPPLEAERTASQNGIGRGSARPDGTGYGTPKIPENAPVTDEEPHAEDSDAELRNLGRVKKNHNLFARTGQQLRSRFRNFKEKQSKGLENLLNRLPTVKEGAGSGGERQPVRELQALRQELAVKDRLIRDKDDQLMKREAAYNKSLKRMKRQQAVLLDKLEQLEVAVAKTMLHDYNYSIEQKNAQGATTPSAGAKDAAH